MTKILSKPEFIKELEKQTEAFLSDEQTSMAKLSGEAGQLAAYTKDTIMRNAKRTRPYLFYLAYRGLNPEGSDFPWNLAIAIELYHQFLLIHDDVIDHDLVRHGGPNVAGSYDEQLQSLIPQPGERLEMATALAILAGDVCFSWVYEQIALAKLSATQQVALGRSLHGITQKEVAGQQLDIMSNSRDISQVTTEQILTIYDNKTAAYTLELPINWALELSQAPPEQTKLWQSFAQKVGRAYQISDDLIGLFSDSKTTGKPVGGDIREGKKTILLRLAYENLESADWQKVEAMLGKSFNQPQLDDLLNLLKQRGIYDQAVAMSETLVKEARANLDGIKIAAASRAELVSLIDGLSTRKA